MSHKFATLFLSFLLCIILIYSCDDGESPPSDAVLISYDQMKTTVGYDWVEAKMDEYNPKEGVISEIKQVYNPEKHSFVIFSKPSCSCDESSIPIAYFLKIIFSAEIPESKYSLYTMQSVKSNHPFTDKITLSALPDMYVITDSVWSVSFRKKMTDYIAGHPNEDTVTYEQLILDELKK